MQTNEETTNKDPKVQAYCEFKSDAPNVSAPNASATLGLKCIAKVTPVTI